MNLFGITSIIIFFASLGFGLSIYSSNRYSKVNRSWFGVSIFVALWGLGLYGVTSTDSAITAERWQYLLDISAILLPVMYFSFVCNLLGIEGDDWFKRLILYVGAVVAVFSVTPYFKLGVTLKYGFYWVNPGPYYLVFPIFFAAVTTISLVFLIVEYRLSKDKTVRAQIRNTLLAGIIGFGGGITNFFPQVINVYPFGNYFVILYVAFMSYGVLKYKLLSKKMISAQLVSGAIVLVFLFNLLQPDTLGNWAVKFLLFILVLIFSIILVRGVYNEISQKEKIEKLAEELKAANEGQVSLMHFMNHQVKGRFGNAKNIFAELMTDDYGAMPPATIPLLQKGLDETNMGIDYVQNVLRGASAENGKIPYEMKPIDFKQILQTAFAKEKDRAESKGLKFELRVDEGEYSMHGDSRELSEAVRNLIDNSITYTQEGCVEVSLSGDKYAIKLNLKDTGVGIIEEDKPKLFKSGVRGTDSLKFNVNSTGYGLAFVKGVIDAHKGRVWAESEGRWKGSTFNVELPKG